MPSDVVSRTADGCRQATRRSGIRGKYADRLRRRSSGAPGVQEELLVSMTMTGVGTMQRYAAAPSRGGQMPKVIRSGRSVLCRVVFVALMGVLASATALA